MMTKKIGLFLIIIFMSAGAGAFAADEVGQQFEGFNLQGFSENGTKSWDLNGDTADIQGNDIQITNVDAYSYGDQKVNIKSQSGTINKASGTILLERDVVITTEEGTQMSTDSLRWERNEDLVTTEDEVTIDDERMHAVGSGATAHPGLQLAQMNKDVTVHVKTEPKNPQGQIITITCDGPMKINQAENKAIFNENVLAVQEGRELQSDVMELFFDPEQEQIKKMICIGNVSIVQGENKTFAERAVYDVTDGTLVLTGKPKLIMLTEGEGGLASLGKEKSQ